MKRILALLLSVAMVIALVAVPAAAEGEVTITASTVTDVTPGSTVDITVDIGGADYQAHILMMNLVYDENNLTVMSVAPGEVWNALPMDAAKTCDYTANPGHIALGFMCPTDPISAHGTFVTVSFLVDENCTQDQTVQVAVSEMWYNPLDGETSAVPFIASNGMIDLVEAPVDPTDPPADPTDPPADPTDPPTDPTDPPAEVVYERVDTLEVGEKYIITSGDYAVGNTIYANNHYLTAHSVSFDGDYVLVPGSLDVNTILYLCEAGDASTGYSFKNVGNNKYMGFDSSEYLYPSDTALYWLQENVTSAGCDLNNQIDSEGYYYLAIGSTNAYFTTSKNANGLINFYKQVGTPDDFYTISEIYIEGFTAPTWDAHPDYTVNVPAGAHYSIDYVDWNWWDVESDDGDILAASATFNDEDCVYYMYFEILPAEGYTFAEDVTVYVNGDPTIIENAGVSESYGYFWAYTIDYTVDPSVTPPASELDEALNVAGADPFLHFETEGAYPWTTVEDGSRFYAISTNQGVSSSESVLSMTYEVPSNKAISFDFMAWGEGSSSPWDKCIFAIDGNAQFTYGALDNDWTTFTVDVPSGTHTFTWTYSKDSSVNPTGDYFAVDNVQFKDREVQPVNEELDEALNVEGGEIHFFSTGTYPWITATEGSRFYAKNGNTGVSSSTSELTATVVAEAGDIIQFEFKAWGEGESTFWDHCDFYVDGARVLYYGQYDNEWETFVYNLTAGEHTLKWSYTKDGSVDATGDYFAVDNVYCGEPVHVDNIIADSVMVPVNRTALINYVVLPAEAADKSVTFVCADTSIATVNANGLVTGVSEGTTVITITSVDNPDVFCDVEVEVIDTGITAAYFYGICAYDLAEAQTDNWITFADYDPSTVTALGAAPDSYAAAYAYGNVYGFTTGGDFYVAPFDNLAGYSVINAGAYTDGTIVSMAYNYADAIMYGLDSSNNQLVAIDIDSGYTEPVGYLTAEDVIAIAITEEGVGYAIAFDGNLYRFDPETAECTVVGNTGCSVNYVQDICYDFNNHDLYWAQIYSASSASFYRVDMNSGYAEDLGPIGPSGMEVCGLFVVPNEEPERPTDIAVTGIELIPDEIEIRVGETGTFTAVVKPINASNKDVDWDVDDPSIIAIDANGTVIGLAVGTATVYATTIDGELTAYGIVNVIPPLGAHLTGYFFETNPLNDGWQFVDYDGDGYNWGWDNSTYTPYEGSGLIYSQSYDNPTYSALDPDNWAISPAIILPSETADVTLYAMGQDPDYASEVFAVYVGTTTDVSQMTKVAGDFTATGEYVQYSANLGDYCGQTVYVAIRHYNISDMFILNVDQVEFWGDGDVDGAHTLTIDYVYEDGTQAAPSYTGMFTEGFTYSVTSPTINGYIANPAVVTGVMGTEDIDVEVVYTIDPNACLVGFYFEESPYGEGWQFIDDDGDGYNWVWQQDYSNPPYCTAYEGEGLIYSQSYDNDSKDVRLVLYPDNWAVTPAIQLPTGSAYVTLYACGQDANYAAEHFQLYAGTSEDIYSMQPISGEFVATGAYLQYRAELTDYLGQTVYIAIRHYNVTDMFYLNVDQVEVFGADGEPVEPTEPPVEPTPGPTEPPVEPTPGPTEPVEPTDVPVEPTDVPVEPTDVPVEPTDVPVEPTDVPVEPTPTPTPAPQTGAVSLVGLGILAMASAAGIVLFRKKED